MHVHDVVAAGAKLAAQWTRTASVPTETFDIAPFDGQPQRAAERHQIIGHLARLWTRAAMEHAGEAVVGVVGRQ